MLVFGSGSVSQTQKSFLSRAPHWKKGLETIAPMQTNQNSSEN
jgi:hypothetical protein